MPSLAVAKVPKDSAQSVLVSSFRHLHHLWICVVMRLPVVQMRKIVLPHFIFKNLIKPSNSTLSVSQLHSVSLTCTCSWCVWGQPVMFATLLSTVLKKGYLAEFRKTSCEVRKSVAFLPLSRSIRLTGLSSI